jgi:hypothetical protein
VTCIRNLRKFCDLFKSSVSCFQDIVACRAVYRRRVGKHVPAATDMHAIIEVMLETVFSSRSVQRGYKKDNWTVGREPSFGEDVSAEAKESRLLEAVTRKCLVTD